MLAYAVPYLVRARHLAANGRPVPRGRVACYLAGLVVLAGAELIPSDDRFSLHMAEHLLIGDVAALLLVLGLTGPVLAPVLKRTRVFRFLSHPLVALPAWALSLYVWHLPPLYEGAVAHPRCTASSTRRSCSSP